MKLKLVGKRKEAENITTFLFEPEKPVSWQPGQFMIYSLPHDKEDIRGRQRFFTISRAPHEKLLAITTRIFPKPSTFKKKLNTLKIGDEILAKGPNGSFVIQDLNKNYVFLAGGIGITPYRSIILDLNHRKKPVNVTLIFSNKTADFPFKEELDKLGNANIKVIYLNKRIDKETLKEYVRDLKNSIFYVSGPDAMVEDMLKVLEDLKIKEENIVSDYFSGYD